MFFPTSKNYFLHEIKIRFVLHEKSVFVFLQIFKDFLLQTAGADYLLLTSFRTINIFSINMVTGNKKNT